MSWLVSAFFDGMASGATSGVKADLPLESDIAPKLTAQKTADVAAGFAPTIEIKLIPPPIPKPPTTPGPDGKPIIMG